MYTLQSWWTMAREGLDVTTIIFNNGSYAVLNMELNRVGADGRRPEGQGDARPPPARPRLRRARHGHGRPRHPGRPPARSSPTQLRTALATPGPTVIEAIVPSIV